jgi:hypothetical protein
MTKVEKLQFEDDLMLNLLLAHRENPAGEQTTV